MRSLASTPGRRADPAEWDVARPWWPSRVPGVDMAGFGVPGTLTSSLRIVPHPAVMLALEFGAGAAVVHDGTGTRPVGGLVAGPGLGAGGAVRVSGSDVMCLQVRLSPVVARAALGVGPAELGGAMVSLDDLWGRDASRLRERLAEAASWQERFRRVDAYLARRSAERRPVDPEVARAWQRIAAGRGLVRVDDLAAEVGWSRRRLWDRFRTQLGMPPKSAAKLIRFDRAVHRLVAGAAPTQVAADGGYFDQSHLHRDVRSFTGLTPAAVAAEPFLTVDDTAWPGR
ncbi:helix-turn-helix domain-containing protein [Streptomyces sp. SID8379]|uniref:helix-turn-helix domain-containing protein n=1 Tax=unclassified Streptomyces TaxID=2593676 RepID=UPI00037E16CE|nr:MULTISPECIES: helix-turn-helix domain-containing protein [unclassified Streptomyces]MYW69724.1 helix-turn-helix domain-containing protein [Streptomyces sp. SID8379]